MEFFKYEKVKSFGYKIIEETSKTKIGEISFPSPVITIYPENNFVYIDFIEPKKENFSAIVLLHSFLEREKGITKLLSNYLSKGDFGVYLICLPYHRKRTPKNYKNGQLFLTTNFERSINAYRQAVIDTLVFIDWLNERKEVKNIGIVGISLGAFILNTIMGIDRRIKCGVSILGAGNIHYIFVRSILTLPLVFYGFTHGIRIKDYKKVTKDYIKYLKDIKEKGIDNVDCKWKWFLIDPLTYAHLNNPRKVLMINGYFDLIVPFSAVIQLWKALGKPEKLFLP
ncbi:MAG: hypothetical protein NZ891_03050, partial [bacterium]|nr:hypothetical protein [bacterium]MDW8163702.1 hypothetical protein [Candidatus Omnitrophota bacterium]